MKFFSYLNRIEKMLAERDLHPRAEEEDIKRILAVYFEQNVTKPKNSRNLTGKGGLF